MDIKDLPTQAERNAAQRIAEVLRALSAEDRKKVIDQLKKKYPELNK